jgi:hypothetical protein
MNSNDRARLSEIVSVGIEAEALLNNKLMASLIFSKKNAACESFLSTKINDDSSRKIAWHDAQAVITFERELQQLVENGYNAKQELGDAENFSQPNFNPIKNGTK